MLVFPDIFAFYLNVLWCKILHQSQLNDAQVIYVQGSADHNFSVLWSKKDESTFVDIIKLNG